MADKWRQTQDDALGGSGADQFASPDDTPQPDQFAGTVADVFRWTPDDLFQGGTEHLRPLGTSSLSLSPRYRAVKL